VFYNKASNSEKNGGSKVVHKIILEEKYSLIKYDLRTFKLQKCPRASREHPAATEPRASGGSAPESARNVQIFASTDV